MAYHTGCFFYYDYTSKRHKISCWSRLLSKLASIVPYYMCNNKNLSWLIKNADCVFYEDSCWRPQYRLLRFYRFFTILPHSGLDVLSHCKVNIHDENINEPILESRKVGESSQSKRLSKCMIFQAKIRKFLKISVFLADFSTDFRNLYQPNCIHIKSFPLRMLAPSL